MSEQYDDPFARPRKAESQPKHEGTKRFLEKLGPPSGPADSTESEPETDPGADSPTKKIKKQKHRLPAIHNFDHLLKAKKPLAPELIAGIMRIGAKLLLSGPAKAGKSFALIELAVALCTGGKWLGHLCRKSRVLYVNNEIDDNEFTHRIVDVANALGVVPEVLVSASTQTDPPNVTLN